MMLSPFEGFLSAMANSEISDPIYAVSFFHLALFFLGLSKTNYSKLWYRISVGVTLLTLPIFVSCWRLFRFFSGCIVRWKYVMKWLGKITTLMCGALFLISLAIVVGVFLEWRGERNIAVTMLGEWLFLQDSAVANLFAALALLQISIAGLMQCNADLMTIVYFRVDSRARLA